MTSFFFPFYLCFFSFRCKALSVMQAHKVNNYSFVHVSVKISKQRLILHVATLCMQASNFCENGCPRIISPMADK